MLLKGGKAYRALYAEKQMSDRIRAFGSPLRYIQGAGEFAHIPEYAKSYGRACYIIDGFLYEDVKERLRKLYEGNESEFQAICFEGECCQEEIDRILKLADGKETGVFVGIGGGKTLDTAKLCADESGRSIFIVPSSASTDAPVSEIAVLYTKDGEYIGSKKVKRNADLVIVDSEIIVKAPKRLFLAGIADALATCFEAEVCEKTKAPNYIGKGYLSCKAGMAISRCCQDIIFQDSFAALKALEAGTVTEEFENVVEANILLSGLGFLNTGLATAHGIHSGLTALSETHKYLHGEKVAFGIVCQLILENADKEKLDKTLTFMTKMGLPVTLGDVGVTGTEENIRTIAQKTVGGPLVHHEEQEVTLDLLCEVIRKADATGKKYKSS